MRILSLLSLDVFRLSMGWALESVGHRVYHLNEVRADLLQEAVRVFKPDVYFDMGWDVDHNDGKVPVIRDFLQRTGLYHVYFAEEDSLHFERWSRQYVQAVPTHFVLTRAPNLVTKYLDMKMGAAYLDVGCNPEYHRPGVVDAAYACDVSVVVHGQFVWDIFRRQSITNLVVPLFDQPYDTRIWGRDWEQTAAYFGRAPRAGMHQGLLPFWKTPNVYNAAKINISVQSQETQISNRTYDVLASGGFLLTSDTPGVREKLVPGVHCEVSSSPEETLSKVAYYLTHETERLRIARAGLEHARRTFAYQATLPDVWKQVETHRLQNRGVTVG